MNNKMQASLAEFRVRRRESSMIRFLPRHVRGRKHFARSERRIVRYQRTTEAQNAAKLFQQSKNCCPHRAAILPHAAAQTPPVQPPPKSRRTICIFISPSPTFARNLYAPLTDAQSKL